MKKGQTVTVKETDTAMDGLIPQQKSIIEHVKPDAFLGTEYGIKVYFKGKKKKSLVYFVENDLLTLKK